MKLSRIASNMARQSSLIPRTNETYIPRATTLQFHSHFLPRIRHRHLQISLGSVPVAVLFPSRRGPIMLHPTLVSPNDTAINIPGNCFFSIQKILELKIDARWFVRIVWRINMGAFIIALVITREKPILER